jgi:hypothetical protein
VHKNLLDILRIHVNIFYFLGNNVLALTQLKNVLLSVNNFQGSITQPLTNVASVMPAQRVDCLIRSFRISEITEMELKFLGFQNIQMVHNRISSED